MTSLASSSSGKPDRLFVGNLSPTVDEYTLVQVFSKFGKITKLDVMYHNSGPLKGKPRGYAFVEFSSKDDALKALVKLNDRLLRGRKLVVTFANAAPPDEGMYPKSRRVGDSGKPTTLSLLKARGKPKSAEAQIAAMEAKLAAMSQRPDRSPTPERIAADTLEAEIQREIAAGAGTPGAGTPGAGTPGAGTPGLETPDIGSPSVVPASPRQDAASAASPAHRAGSTDSAPSAKSPPVEPPQSAALPLPPKPAPAPRPPRPQDERARRRQEEFQRGLASLPKKPTFTL